MSKTLNKTVQFVKVNQVDIHNDIPYRVKSFGLTESVIIIDKKATNIKNEHLIQDSECYSLDKKIKLQKSNNNY